MEETCVQTSIVGFCFTQIWETLFLLDYQWWYAFLSSVFPPGWLYPDIPTSWTLWCWCVSLSSISLINKIWHRQISLCLCFHFIFQILISHNNEAIIWKKYMGGQNIYNTRTNHCKYLILRIKTHYKKKSNNTMVWQNKTVTIPKITLYKWFDNTFIKRGKNN